MARGNSPVRENRGFSLIELTIALAIFSTGLGGFALLLMLAIQDSAATRLQNLALIQASAMAETIRLVPGPAVDSLTPREASACMQGVHCEPELMAEAALHRWQHKLAAQVPGASGVLCLDSSPFDGRRDDPSCDGSGTAVIKVLWQEPGREENESLLERRVVTRLSLP